MDKQDRPLRRITGLANWTVPAHSDMFDLEFDAHRSLLAGARAAWADGFAILMSLAQLVAYGYFFYSIWTLPRAVCSGPLAGLLHFIPAAAAVQLAWAIKAVYFMDRAAGSPGGIVSTVARIIRTTVLTLPFSFAPTWIIGGLAWPVLRIGLRGGTNFYDQALMIGQYVQNSLWYVGARRGALSENLAEFSDLTISSRSRYWDIASEATIINVVAMLVLGVGIYVFGLIFVDFKGAVVIASREVDNIVLLFGSFFAAVSILLTSTNTSAIGAIALLERARAVSFACLEEYLSPDAMHRWLLYVPHALVALALYGISLFIFLPRADAILCNV